MDDLKLYGNSEKETKRLTHTIRIFSKDITINFGISKCAHVTMKAGKLVSVGGMELSSEEVIPELESDKGYKYLGILEANDIMGTEMKDKIQKEYYRRVRQLTLSKLSGGNTIRAINTHVFQILKGLMMILTPSPQFTLFYDDTSHEGHSPFFAQFVQLHCDTFQYYLNASYETYVDMRSVLRTLSNIYDRAFCE